jgi:hypothetical protein
MWTDPPEHPDATAPEWRNQYLVERRKARIFMASTAITLAALIGTLAFDLASSDPVQAPTAFAGEGLPDPPGDGTGLRGGRGAIGGVERFLNDDGSVNTAAVDETLSRFADRGGVPERFAERMIGNVDDAVAAGTLTKQQGLALLAALGISGGTDA